MVFMYELKIDRKFTNQTFILFTYGDVSNRMIYESSDRAVRKRKQKAERRQ